MADRPLPAALSSHRTLWFVGTALAIAVAATLVVVGPREGSPCLILAATGVSCPGCGMTRAAAAMLRGNWSSMWALHPMAPFVAMQGLAVWVLWGWTVFVRKRTVDEVVLLGLLVVNTTALALVWVVRLVLGALPAP